MVRQMSTTIDELLYNDNLPKLLKRRASGIEFLELVDDALYLLELRDCLVPVTFSEIGFGGGVLCRLRSGGGPGATATVVVLSDLLGIWTMNLLFDNRS